jgi:hypothetical protein
VSTGNIKYSIQAHLITAGGRDERGVAAGWGFGGARRWRKIVNDTGSQRRSRLRRAQAGALADQNRDEVVGGGTSTSGITGQLIFGSLGILLGALVAFIVFSQAHDIAVTRRWPANLEFWWNILWAPVAGTVLLAFRISQFLQVAGIEKNHAMRAFVGMLFAILQGSIDIGLLVAANAGTADIEYINPNIIGGNRVLFEQLAVPLGIGGLALGVSSYFCYAWMRWMKRKAARRAAGPRKIEIGDSGPHYGKERQLPAAGPLFWKISGWISAVLATLPLLLLVYLDQSGQWKYMKLGNMFILVPIAGFFIMVSCYSFGCARKKK